MCKRFSIFKRHIIYMYLCSFRNDILMSLQFDNNKHYKCNNKLNKFSKLRKSVILFLLTSIRIRNNSSHSLIPLCTWKSKRNKLPIMFCIIHFLELCCYKDMRSSQFFFEERNHSFIRVELSHSPHGKSHISYNNK